MKTKIIILFLIVGFLYIGGRYIYYGAVPRNCIYTENQSPIPKPFAKAKITVKIEPLTKGTTFQITDRVVVTKHGITTIDSGRGPIDYLILKDENNRTYKMALASLGINEDDLFITFSESSDLSTPAKFISPESFYVDSKGELQDTL